MCVSSEVNQPVVAWRAHTQSVGASDGDVHAGAEVVAAKHQI